jgi:hypothetical protein
MVEAARATVIGCAKIFRVRSKYSTFAFDVLFNGLDANVEYLDLTLKTEQYRYIVRFELYERVDFLPVHKLKSPLDGP